MAQDRSISVTGEPAIKARGLTKAYRGRAAVNGIDLTVMPGEVYGFLGPNGAGKTTTMRMLLGLVAPEAGTVRLFGRDPRDDPFAAREGVAGIVEEPRLYPYLTGRTNLRMLADFDRRGVGRGDIEKILETVELHERAGDKVQEYSQGMRQRLGIAACLVRRPRLLLLDEPANGLDPAGIRYLRGLLRHLSSDGMTVFLSSHLLAEVQEICARVAIIAHGDIVYEGEIQELRDRAGHRYTLATDDPPLAAEICDRSFGVDQVSLEGETVRFAIVDESELLPLTRALTEARIVIRGLVPEQLTLERVFFELTEESAHTARVVAR
jgi:ABC-2 type transport system ATP-binding protein